ncbi:uncharacterized protein LOC134237623 [Saccostrea cucullata]|uniref:uncharacterized protein LOC134237623 n=1 Tax=Saccostrea cuccullata TaxID=36930 RepID=UPI002ED2645C
MASSSSNYQTTKETTNASRVLHLLFGPCTDQFRDLLAHHIPPHILFGKLQQERQKRKPYLNKLSIMQTDLLLPKSGVYSPNYVDFDVTLLYTLLRNLSGLPPHKNGWGKDPDPNDFSEAANIERIRILRNKFSHNFSMSISDVDFQDIWTNMKRVIQDIDNILSNGGKYGRAMVPLEYMTMDPNETNRLKKELKRKNQEEIQCKKEIKKFKRDLRKMKTAVQEIQTSSNIPENIQKQHKKTLDNWRKEDEKYVEPHFFQNLMQTISESDITILTGGPGCGKTATSRHIAIKYLDLDFTVIPVRCPGDIISYGDPELGQIFVLDNIFGAICFEEQLYNEFRRNFESIQNILDKKSKLLITCRKNVLIEANQLKYQRILPKTVFDLGNDENELTKDDKLSILSAYFNATDFSGLELQDYVTENCMLPMFPLLCKMFSANADFRNKGTCFFKEPYPIIFDHLEEMEKENRLCYAALVFCMLNAGRISENALENERVLKENVFKFCRVKNGTDNWEIMNAVVQIDGTYLKESEGGFSFLHDLIFEIVACYFGKKFPREIINNLSSEFISRRLTLENETEGDILTIKIPECDYITLANRLYRDTKDLKLYNVFGSEFLHNAKMCNYFLLALTDDKEVNVQDMFLSPISDFKDSQAVSFPCRKNLDAEEFAKLPLSILIEDPSDIFIELDEEDIHDDSYAFLFPRNCRIRLISWVVGYGHEAILRYLHDKMSLNNTDIGAVFGTEVESQLRYLLLGCYSRNAYIVGFILNHTNPACINRYPCLKEKDSDGISFYTPFTPLILSVLLKSVDIVDILLKAGADVNVCDANGNTPLDFAIYTSEINTIKTLIEAGTDLNRCENGTPPLVFAAKLNNTDAVKSLLTNGAHCNYRTEDGTTALYFASKNGNIDMVKTLFEFGADYSIYKNKDKSPFCIATAEGHLFVLEFLLEKGANCNFVDECSRTPIILASERGFLEIVLFLLNKGADCNKCTDFDESPLFAAVRYGHSEIVSLLIDKGADVNVSCRSMFNYAKKSTPLHEAVKLNDSIGINLLQRKYLEYRLENDENMTPLEMSLWMGFKEITNLLIKGENCLLQGKGNEHLYEIITKLRSSVLFLNNGDDVEVKSTKTLYCRESSLVHEVISNDEYGSLSHLLSLGLRTDRNIVLYEKFNPLCGALIACFNNDHGDLMSNFIIENCIDNDNIQLLKLILDHMFKRGMHKKPDLKPFILENEDFLERTEPDFAILGTGRVHCKGLFAHQIGYIMDNSNSILHALLRHISTLKYRIFDDCYPESFLYEHEDYIFISNALAYLKTKMRRHSI